MLVVHGHTPVGAVEHHGNRLAIDTGAVFGRQLTAVEISDRGIAVLGPDGAVAVEVLP
ncbi:hypothetical protein [Paracoccus sp. DMF-8]|uniref:hypothetical protein n=1 Tax=Paracoccus sp. DMF-8 TaxID=3019445 RepID=UPI003204DACB